MFEVLTVLLAIARARARAIITGENSRENFGEFRGRRHHKAIVATGPGDEMLNTGILQHTVRVSFPRLFLFRFLAL